MYHRGSHYRRKWVKTVTKHEIYSQCVWHSLQFVDIYIPRPPPSRHPHTHTPHPTPYPISTYSVYEVHKLYMIAVWYVTNEWYVLFPSHRYSNCGSDRWKSCLVRTSYQITDQSTLEQLILISHKTNVNRKTCTAWNLVWRFHICLVSVYYRFMKPGSDKNNDGIANGIIWWVAGIFVKSVSFLEHSWNWSKKHLQYIDGMCVEQINHGVCENTLCE